MEKRFNTAGNCSPRLHYMVDIGPRLDVIRRMIGRGEYFSINRGRQYGKTTTLKLLADRLRSEYVVFSISLEGLADEEYESQDRFCRVFAELLCDEADYGQAGKISDQMREILAAFCKSDGMTFRSLSKMVSQICGISACPVVLMIDEADQAGIHKIFFDFLGTLRRLYLGREERPTFQSVILAGVYDLRNLRLKVRPEKEHQRNSPWNIAVDFKMDMSLDAEGIAGMLTEYSRDKNIAMDTAKIAGMLHEYTGGYPFLVSRLCQIMDEGAGAGTALRERAPAWTREGLLEAVKQLLGEKNTLFESLVNKLTDYPELRDILYRILFAGEEITFNIFNHVIDIAEMFGFVKDVKGKVAISNRIFEMLLYNLFTSEEESGSRIYEAGSLDKNQFVEKGVLNMDLVMEKFMEHWNEIYGSADIKFTEENGRKIFLLYLKPIVNGTGNFYVESQTRDRRRTDVIVDYRGKQYIIELKIWHGEEYNRRGERQLADYLDAYHAKKGYLLSFNFNKKKTVGMKEITVGDKTILEAVV